MLSARAVKESWEVKSWSGCQGLHGLPAGKEAAGEDTASSQQVCCAPVKRASAAPEGAAHS